MPIVLKNEISVGPCREQRERKNQRDRCPQGRRKLGDGSLHVESTLQGEKGSEVSTGRCHSPAVSPCILTPQRRRLFLSKHCTGVNSAVILPHC